MALMVEICSDIVLTAPDPEDGERRERLAYYARVQDAQGARWAHDRSFDDPEPAQALAARIEAALAAGRSLNWDHWNETYPMYGSAAYSDADAVEEEARRERDGGFEHFAHGGWRWAS